MKQMQHFTNFWFIRVIFNKSINFIQTLLVGSSLAHQNTGNIDCRGVPIPDDTELAYLLKYKKSSFKVILYYILINGELH